MENWGFDRKITELNREFSIAGFDKWDDPPSSVDPAGEEQAGVQIPQRLQAMEFAV